MIRESLGKQLTKPDQHFRYRGKESGRLENLSDGVFALAITLLLISTSAPTTFHQIKQFVWELIPFTICIVLIVLIWCEHFAFFYRYGIRDPKIIFLNTTFLIILLFYVYPLKFLWRMLTLHPLSIILDQPDLAESLSPMFRSSSDTALLMIIYGVGFASVFFVLVLMYRHALKNSAKLELNRIEEFDTRTSIRSNLLMALIPTLSIILAVVLKDTRYVGLISGFTYMLYMPVMFTHGFISGRKRERLLLELNDLPPPDKPQQHTSPITASVSEHAGADFKRSDLSP